MKARIKATGEIVEIEDLYDDGTALVKGRYFKVSELDFFAGNYHKATVEELIEHFKEKEENHG